ncbi:MAG: hypothetical protein LBO66_07575 [Deltaproteobacteria bacterium]|jgi:hypothetical protein|nr:hypothetical protein [Deltaproteobacteria bacterium]
MLTYLILFLALSGLIYWVYQAVTFFLDVNRDLRDDNTVKWDDHWDKERK